MKAALVADPHKPHHRRWLGALAEGLGRHGIASAWVEPGQWPGCDFACHWGWRTATRIVAPMPRLILEAGYLGDRLTGWASAGWNGLNGRAEFHNADSPGDRAARWCRLLQPCRAFGAGTVVIMGQVAGDQAWHGVDPATWYRRTYALVKEATGRPVYFRPHPFGGSQNHGMEEIAGSLDEALALAGGVVTFNSNAGVDAVLAGVPTIAADPGSMVWGLVPSAPPFEPVDSGARLRWLERLAYCQWTAEELRDGTAWDHIGKGLK